MDNELSGVLWFSQEEFDQIVMSHDQRVNESLIIFLSRGKEIWSLTSVSSAMNSNSSSS